LEVPESVLELNLIIIIILSSIDSGYVNAVSIDMSLDTADYHYPD